VTRVDFYILPEGSPDGAALTAAKLCDKAVNSGHRVYLHSVDTQEQEALDKLLWSFRQGSFLAHERYVGAPLVEPLPSALLGTAEPPATHLGVLINTAAEVPEFFSRFERVLEIVPGDAASRAKSRARFKFYRDRGYELKTYEQTAEGGWMQRN
jgi:DNA polymerase-3 subunit chi